jgi:lipoprotein
MQKISLLVALPLVAAMALTSCNSRAKLAQSLQGQWSGNPEKVLDTGAATASAVRVLNFTQGSADTEGTITISALITVENTMPFNDSIQTPLTISASGTASVTGIYQVKDHDEIIVSLDASSFTTDVDPEGVQLNYNILTQNSGSTTDRLRPAALILARQQITRAAQSLITNISEIDDIHVDGNIMKCEIGHRDIVFSRAPGMVPDMP